MAIAATNITCGKGLLDLIQQTAPPKERAVELYRRLLAINDLSGAMSQAKDISQLKGCLMEYFQECLPDEQVRLCLIEGLNYRRFRLSGKAVPKEESFKPIGDGISGSVLKSGSPLWIPDTQTSSKSRILLRKNTGNIPMSILVIPFSTEGKVVGCLEMFSSCPNRLDEIEYHLGSIVTTHLSSSMVNVITRQELAQANDRLRNHDSRMTQLNEKLQQLAHTDEATGLYNKRRLREQLDMEIARARRYGEVFSCFMIDIDDFKLINDMYGHQAGDEVLRQTGTLLRHSLRRSDFIARFGGEEFTVLLPRTNSAGAYRAAENLRTNFMSNEFTLPATNIHITISIGITTCTSFDRLDTQQVILSADTALYRAKRSGKNMVCFNDDNGSSNKEVMILSKM